MVNQVEQLNEVNDMFVPIEITKLNENESTN